MHTEKYKSKVTYQIRRITHGLQLPTEAEETALSLYSQYHSKNTNFNKPHAHIAAACVHLSCQIHDEPISISDLSQYSPKDPLLKAKNAVKTVTGVSSLPSPPSTHIDRYADQFPDSVVSEAHDLLSNVSSSRSPRSQAAATLYAATQNQDKSISQQKVSDILDVSEVTIRQSYRDYLESS